MPLQDFWIPDLSHSGLKLHFTHQSGSSYKNMLKSLADFTLIFISGLTHEDSFQRGQWRHSPPITACNLILITSAFLLLCFKWKQAKVLNKNKLSSSLSIKKKLEQWLPTHLQCKYLHRTNMNSRLTRLRDPETEQGNEGLSTRSVCR